MYDFLYAEALLYYAHYLSVLLIIVLDPIVNVQCSFMKDLS